MNNPKSTIPATSKQHSNRPEQTERQATTSQHPADSHRTKEVRSHLCITIRWGGPPPSYLAVTNGGGDAVSPSARAEVGDLAW